MLVNMSSRPLIERLADKFLIGDECWPWIASKGTQGYGQISYNGRPRVAHRIVYELLVGPVPDGLQLDHLCRNRACVRPDHLEPVTNAENLRRGAHNNQFKGRTHCPQGHPYDEANTYHYTTPAGGPGRSCRACHRETERQRRVAR